MDHGVSPVLDQQGNQETDAGDPAHVGTEVPARGRSDHLQICRSGDDRFAQKLVLGLGPIAGIGSRGHAAARPDPTEGPANNVRPISSQNIFPAAHTSKSTRSGSSPQPST